MDQFVSGRPEDGDCGVLKEEKKSENSVCDDQSSHKQDTVVEELPIANAEMSMVEAEPSASPSMKEDEVDDQLEITKAQMGEVREENQRLKMSLNKIMNEYRTLEMQFQDIAKQDQTKKNIVADDNNHQEIMEESDLVSLSLGRVPSNPRNIKVSKPLKDHEEFNEDLTLGLDCKLETSKSGSTNEAALPNPSPVNSCEVPKEEEAGETSPPTTKAPLKTMRDIEDEVAQQTHAKKARVCVRARCDTPTMNDGCQWRKYGQKISKGNPCPRAYYRCTVAPSCPVRKQVQRCAEDMSILITTYEGTHNHTLPHSATAMASTTSAAASMLLSGSSTSSTTNNNLHGLNFYLSSDGSKSKQLHHLSNPALSSSSHHDHPTITLDLTTNPNSSSSSSPFVRFNNQLRYPSSTSLSFNSSESNAMSWTNNGFLNYATHQPYNNNNNRNILSSVNFGRQQAAENIYQSYMQKNNNINSIPPSQSETVSAATKAITAHPNFQSALAAALTSFIGSSNTPGNLGHKMTWAELFPAASNSTATLPSTSKASASNFFNKTPSSLPFSTPKSASASPGDSNGNTD